MSCKAGCVVSYKECFGIFLLHFTAILVNKYDTAYLDIKCAPLNNYARNVDALDAFRSCLVLDVQHQSGVVSANNDGCEAYDSVDTIGCCRVVQEVPSVSMYSSFAVPSSFSDSFSYPEMH